MNTVNVETPTPTPAPLEKTMTDPALTPVLTALAAAEAEYLLYGQKFTDARSAVIRAYAAVVAATDEARAIRKATDEYHQARDRFNAVNAELERSHKVVRDRVNAVQRAHDEAVAAAKALKGREARAEAVKAADAAARLAAEGARTTREEYAEQQAIYERRTETWQAAEEYQKVQIAASKVFDDAVDALVPATLSDRRFMIDRIKEHAFALVRA